MVMIDETNEAIIRAVARVERLEEYTRKENVIIRGIEMAGEGEEKELLQKVKEVANSLDVELQDRHISTVHRLSTRATKRPPPVVVRLVNRWKKEELIAASKQKKMKRIFISNQLTPEKLKLLRRAFDLKRENVVNYVWTMGSKLMVRKNEVDEAIQIVDMDMLKRLGWKEEMERNWRRKGDDVGIEEGQEENTIITTGSTASGKKKQQQSTLDSVFRKEPSKGLQKFANEPVATRSMSKKGNRK